MGTYYGTARSNYVRVKDAAAFRAFIGSFPDLELQEHEAGFVFYAAGDHGWDFSRDDDAEEMDVEAFAEALSEHLAEGQVAVLIEVGNEKLRYLTGSALAVDWRGNTVDVSLFSIYEKAATVFRVDPETITAAEY